MAELPTGAVTFRLLGPLAVERDGETLELRGHNQRAVLALLLLEAGRVISKDRFIDALWAESPPKTAATSLQNMISQLRKHLGGVLVTRPPGYALDIAPEQVDLHRFRIEVEAARAMAPAERAARLREALALWRGPPLADFTYDAFAETEIAQLEDLRLAAIEERVEADLETGRAGELVGELEALVGENPLRERLRRQLMLALYRCGRQAEALQVYHDARRTLVGELGIEPTPELQQLHARILRQEAGLAPGAPQHAGPDRFADIADALREGRLIPVLGNEIAELTARLAGRFDYPAAEADPLPRVAQYVAVVKGRGPLYDELHAFFDANAPVGPVHRFLASLPSHLRAAGVPHQLVVTTNYDLALEQAFRDAGEAVDVVSYVATGKNRGKFCHTSPSGESRLIESPKTYATELSLDERTIILRLHGQVDRTPERSWESFVVIEDDYIEYLAQTDVASVVPVGLVARLRRSHLLFLGYSMTDWNLRLLLHRIWGDQPLNYRSWAIQPDATNLEREFWRRRDVDVIDLPLDRCIELISEHARLAAPAAAP